MSTVSKISPTATVKLACGVLDGCSVMVGRARDVDAILGRVVHVLHRQLFPCSRRCQPTRRRRASAVLHGLAPTISPPSDTLALLMIRLRDSLAVELVWLFVDQIMGL